MTESNEVSQLIYQKSKGGRFHWITVATLMLAIGTILHLVSPSIAGITPNWTIATYCVAILLTKPNYRQCLGIGLVAAMLNLITSKSGFPYGNLISEPFGALTGGFIAHHFSTTTPRRTLVVTALAGMIATLVSGFIFVTVLKFVLNIDFNVYFYVILPAVALVAIGNAIITPLLYIPAKKLFSTRGDQSAANSAK